MPEPIRKTQARIAERERRRKEEERKARLFKIIPFALIALVAMAGAGYFAFTSLVKPPKPSNPGIVGPRIEVDREQLDLGNRKLNEPIRAQFTIKNVGDDTLNLGIPDYVTAIEGC